MSFAPYWIGSWRRRIPKSAPPARMERRWNSDSPCASRQRTPTPGHLARPVYHFPLRRPGLKRRGRPRRSTVAASRVWLPPRERHPRQQCRSLISQAETPTKSNLARSVRLVRCWALTWTKQGVWATARNSIGEQPELSDMDVYIPAVCRGRKKPEVTACGPFHRHHTNSENYKTNPTRRP